MRRALALAATRAYRSDRTPGSGAGIDVAVGLLEAEARALNATWLAALEHGEPAVPDGDGQPGAHPDSSA